MSKHRVSWGTRGNVASIAIALMSCAGCRPAAPTDLQFKSIALVELASVTNPEPDNFEHVRPAPKHVFRVEFKSAGDLLRFRRKWAGTYLRAASCDEWEREPKASLVPFRIITSSVFWGDVNVMFPGSANDSKENAPFVYHFFMDSDTPSTKSGDVCFQLTSVRMLLPGAKTNVVRIPKSAISSAVEVR